jgi:hypothetical protein
LAPVKAMARSTLRAFLESHPEDKTLEPHSRNELLTHRKWLLAGASGWYGPTEERPQSCLQKGHWPSEALSPLW